MKTNVVVEAERECFLLDVFQLPLLPTALKIARKMSEFVSW